MENDRLVNACIALVERAKELAKRWEKDELNDSHFGKNLYALAGITHRYHGAYDEFHLALQEALAEEELSVMPCGCPALD